MMDRLAVSLLAASLSTADRDAIIGDLIEESAMRSRGWLWWQALRSIAPSLRTRWSRGELQEPILVPVLLVMLPLRALDLLWAYVLSSVPLRAAADRPIAFLVTSLVCLGIGSFISGRIVRTPYTWTGVVLTMVCLATAPGPIPGWYAGIALLLSAASMFQRRTV